ncbi:MAG: IS3 family transposase [Alcanivorax sp.]
MKPKQTSKTSKSSATKVVKDIRRANRKIYSAEEKIRIVLTGLRGETTIAELCRIEGIAQSLYYSWSKEFLEAGKQRLAGDTARNATSDEVKELRRESRDLKEVVAEQTLELRLLKKKHDRGWGVKHMRYSASEKLEIIRTVEQSHLSARETLDKIGISRPTFYRWYDKYASGGFDALADKPSKPSHVWNRIPDKIRDQIIEFALECSELSPRELAVKFTDTQGYFVSEASVYRLLRAQDLITSPAFVVVKAANEFKDKPTRVNQQWQTDFTYFKIIGWGWYYLSTVLDDFSRYIIAWKLCKTMKASDVTKTLEMALEASGCDSAKVIHKPRLLSDNGASYVASDLADFLKGKGMSHVRGKPYHPQTQGKIERWHQTLKNRVLLDNYYLPSHLEHEIGQFIEYYNHERYHESLDNLTPADVYFGRGNSILEKRRKLKNKTIQQRRLQHLKIAA